MTESSSASQEIPLIKRTTQAVCNSLQGPATRDNRRIAHLRAHLPLLLLALALFLWIPSVLNPAVAIQTQKVAETTGAHVRINRSRPRVGAYYSTFNEPFQWENTRYQPTLGLYDSNASTVVTRHSDWALHAGINFFVVRYDHNNMHKIKEYLQHPKAMTIALLVDSIHLYKQSVQLHSNLTEFEYDGQIDFQRMVTNIHTQEVGTFGDCFLDYIFIAMEELVKPFSEKYLHVGERPMFLLDSALDYVNHDATMTNLRLRFKQRFSAQPYLVADSVSELNNKDRKQIHDASVHFWDAITTKSRFDGSLSESPEQYMDRVEAEYEFYAKTSDQPGARALMFPYVQPGYDDSLLHTHEKLGKTKRPVYPTGDGSFYQQFWDLGERILSKNPCAKVDSDEMLVFVSTFNNWSESTSIEPSTEWGKELLRITRDRSRSMKPKCDGSVKRAH
jgi:hypothetical protein